MSHFRRRAALIAILSLALTGAAAHAAPTACPLDPLANDPFVREMRAIALTPGATVDPAMLNPANPRTAQVLKLLADRRTRDWAELCRYKPDNAALVGGGVRVVFMGDSITENWGEADPTLFRDGIVDRGISGQTSPQMLVRFMQDVVDLRPRVVHIVAGTNDVAGNTGDESDDNYREMIRAMVTLAQAHGIRVILGSIPPTSGFTWAPTIRPAARVRALNAWLRDYAAEQGLVFADYYTVLAAPDGGLKPTLGNDGVHPHRGGYSVMRPVADAAIARALAEPAPAVRR